MTEPSIADPPRQVRIASDGLDAHVFLDSADISQSVRGWAIEQRSPDERPLVVLHVLPKDGVLFEGLARVAIGQPADPTEAFVEFLTSVDPKTLENAALNRDDLGNERYDLARAMLAQLAEWATGEKS